MCGIAALLNLQSSRALELLSAMTDSIRHRGPDDEGFVLFYDERAPLPLGGADTPASAYEARHAYAPRERLTASLIDGAIAAFGHRRLSILDLSPAGHQPLCSPDGRYWITYNGEIYNYLELRTELEGLGYEFTSHSDTDVILAAYDRWGKDCLHRFNGMWSFVIADRKEKRFFAARDRFGVKPLYYWVSPQGFLAVASEIKQFTVLPGWDARVNGQRAYDFLHWSLNDHTPETLFEGVHQVLGGEAFEMGFFDLPTAVRPYRWYHLEGQPFSGTMAEASDRLRELLKDSIRLRLRADVPVGSCLSGGLDSSSIVCLANDLLKEQGIQGQQRTFSACAEVERYNERGYVDQVVHARGIDAYYTYPRLEDLFESLDSITWHQDEPFGSASIFAQWHVFKLAAENGVTVMLDGQGADEQLAGYHGYFGSRYSDLFRRLQWVTLWNEIQRSQQLHRAGGLSALKKLANAALPDTLVQALNRMRGRGAAPEWLDMRQLGARSENPTAKLGFNARTVHELSYAQLTATNLPMLLHYEDRDSMAHSIESRVPFLDYRLVEFSLGLPDEYKLSEGVTKRVLREGMKGVIPDGINARMDKMGFVTPEEVWMREHSPERFRQAMKEAIEASSGVLDQGAMKVLEQMIRGEEPFHFLPWRMISFGAWVRRFGVRVS